MLAMKTANIAEFKNGLSGYLAAVERGEEVEICRHNKPLARLVPLVRRRKNRTKLDSMKGSVRILGSLTEPMIPESDWEMLR